jgi:hypothetical protein
MATPPNTRFARGGRNSHGAKLRLEQFPIKPTLAQQNLV